MCYAPNRAFHLYEITVTLLSQDVVRYGGDTLFRVVAFAESVGKSDAVEMFFLWHTPKTPNRVRSLRPFFVSTGSPRRRSEKSLTQVDFW